MNKQEALTKARKDVARIELDICHAEKRNARTEEMEALRRKLEYRKFIMDAVEVKKESNILLSYGDLAKMHGKPVFCVWPPDEYGAVMTRWVLVRVDKLRNEIVFVNNYGGSATWDELIESDVAFYRYER